MDPGHVMVRPSAVVNTISLPVLRPSLNKSGVPGREETAEYPYTSRQQEDKRPTDEGQDHETAGKSEREVLTGTWYEHHARGPHGHTSTVREIFPRWDMRIKPDWKRSGFVVLARMVIGVRWWSGGG
jgi:hypothetical protein